MAKPDSTVSRPATFGGVCSRVQGFMNRRLWLWPLLAAVMLAFVGVWIRAKMEGVLRAQIAGELRTILEANAEALREWSATMKSQTELLAANEEVRKLVGSLVRRAERQGASSAILLSAPELGSLRSHLKPLEQGLGFIGFAVLDTNMVVLASGRDQYIGAKYEERLQTCLTGKAMVTRPFDSAVLLSAQAGDLRAGVPMMFAAAPVMGTDGGVAAVLGLAIAPEKDFTRILATARAGNSGETYAFNAQGLLSSQSRFDDELKRLGLIPDVADAQSLLRLELRDPMVNLSKGRRALRRPSELPFTKAVSESLAGRPGVDASGYRDYRGVEVVGAWMWLPEFELGLVTEIDAAEAFASVRMIRYGFWFLFSLLTAGSVAVFVLMRVARQAALTAKQLGQYALDEEIGTGGFGIVFRGHHALMRRPVAVKVLDPTSDERGIARFEREVQMTCQLTHPNTIALYDYGRTPEGLFYYAMEYLEGLPLNLLVEQTGPQPEGRVIHILRQVCGSLSEAHAHGLVHRDIKPHNIFITRRGGIPDFVKVLDFGLVKARDQDGQLELTGANATLGTPLYMSPEAVKGSEKVDARSDLYSLASVGYYLLTGTTVFCGASLGEVLLHQVRSEPERPSVRMKRPISPDFEDLLMRCLAKDPSTRPVSAAELDQALAHCTASGHWSHSLAEQWWTEHLATQNKKLTVLAKNSAKPN